MSDNNEMRSAWFAVVTGAAASLENAAACMRDPDAKMSALGAAAFARKRAHELWDSAWNARPVAAVEADAGDSARLEWMAKHHCRIATSRPGVTPPYYLVQDTLNDNQAITDKSDYRYSIREAIDVARSAKP